MNILKLQKTSGPQREGEKTREKREKSKNSARLKRKTSRLTSGEKNCEIVLEDGSTYEPIEEVTVIPLVEAYVDDMDSPSALKKSKAKKAQKPSPKVKPVKGRHIDESEVPEMVLMDFVPAKSGRPVICIDCPENKMVNNYVDVLRNCLMRYLNTSYHVCFSNADYAEMRDQLADQLQERIRLHAPRVNSLDVNVVEARKVQLEGRKGYIDTHFMYAVSKFNKTYAALKDSIESKYDNLKQKSEMLREFGKELSAQRSMKGLNEVISAYNTAEKEYMTEVEKTSQEISRSIDAFSATTAAAGKEFSVAVANQSIPFSKEELELCSTYQGKMDQQTAALIKDLSHLVRTREKNVQENQKEIYREFERLLPMYRVDIEFLEAFKEALSEAKSRYDSLLIRNKQSEEEVDMAMRNIANSVHSLGFQERLNETFDELDSLRLKLLRRAKYLGVLKSDIVVEAIPVVIDLSSQVVVEAPVDVEMKKRAASKPKKVSKQPNQVLKGKTSMPISESYGTLGGQMSAIGTEILAQITSLSNEYYKKVKARKVEISHPDIPVDQSTCIETVKQKWQEITADFPAVTEKSGVTLAGQVLKSTDTVREGMRVVFDCLFQYFSQFVITELKEIKAKFSDDESINQKSRSENQKQLLPELGDANCIDVLKDLIDREYKRQSDETNLVETYSSKMMECEVRQATSFANHFPLVTRGALSILDAFPLIEDLTTRPDQLGKRMSVTHMMREKTRKENSSDQMDDRRPFTLREWPTCALTIPEIEVQTHTESSSVAKGKRSFSSKSGPKTETPATEKSTSLYSLDTPLSRFVIIEQKKCVDAYQKEMDSRIESLNNELTQIKESIKQNTQSWRLRILSFKPDWIFPPI